MFFELLSQILFCANGVIAVHVWGEEFKPALRTSGHRWNLVDVALDPEGSLDHSAQNYFTTPIGWQATCTLVFDTRSIDSLQETQLQRLSRSQSPRQCSY
jgi:hypothetical protein